MFFPPFNANFVFFTALIITSVSNIFFGDIIFVFMLFCFQLILVENIRKFEY